jgi:hypothetical protein
MNWTQTPAAAWSISALALVALGMAACLYLFYGMKREVTALRRRLTEERNRFEEERRQLAGELDAYRLSLADLQRAVAESDVPAMSPATAASLAVMAAGLGDASPLAPAPLDALKRGQALRMHRHGATVDEIASKLLVPPGDVALLLKVQRSMGE